LAWKFRTPVQARLGAALDLLVQDQLPGSDFDQPEGMGFPLGVIVLEATIQ